MAPGSFNSGAAQRNGFFEVFNLGDNLSGLNHAIKQTLVRVALAATRIEQAIPPSMTSCRADATGHA
jgi:hypothetical protein